MTRRQRCAAGHAGRPPTPETQTVPPGPAGRARLAGRRGSPGHSARTPIAASQPRDHRKTSRSARRPSLH